MARRAKITLKTNDVRVVRDEAIADAVDASTEIVRYRRPRTREECAQVPRPCPFVGCRYNLYLDETAAGHVYLNFPTVPVLEMKYSCALDLADQGAWSLRDTSDILGLTPERIRQIELSAIEALRQSKLTKLKPEGPRTLRSYTMTHLLLNPKCKRLMLRAINGKMEIDHLHQALLETVPGTISIIKLKAFILSKMQIKQNSAKEESDEESV